jgi:hypothetical protein
VVLWSSREIATPTAAAGWSGNFVNEDAFIETLYNSLTGRKGQFMKHN